jgi:hypothetical protein
VGTVCFVLGESESFPGSIKLLPGYTHQKGRGVDSAVGTIHKNGGLDIEYDIGAGHYTECGALCGWTNGEIWRKEQRIDGQKVVLVFTKQQRLVITFFESNANFYATIRNEEDMADMLLMVLTFRRNN